MKYQLAGVLLAATCGAALLASCAQAQNPTASQNIALQKKVTLDPPSNYEFTKDRNPQQLTDGVYASSNAQWDPVHQTATLWVQKGTLGWAHKKPVIITIDLGEVQPISGLVYSTGAQKGNVNWPEKIHISTSDDGKTWHYAGELVQLSDKHSTPPQEGKAIFRYTTDELKTKGRYIALGVLGLPFVFTDEIEVLRGPDELLQQNAAREIPPMEEFIAYEQIDASVRHRLQQDIADIRAQLQETKLPEARRSTFGARLTAQAAAVEQLPLPPLDLKTILPLNDLHRDILATRGEILAAQGFSPLTLWKQHRYAWLPLIHQPQRSAAPALEIEMLKNQFRSDALLLTNASAQPVTVQVRLQNPPANAQSGWLQLNSAIWTDTQQIVPVQSALLPLQQENGVYSLSVPAGLTGKLWATVDSSKLPTGNHRSTLAVSGAGQAATVPLNVRVSRVAMKTPRLSVAMWDYTNHNGMYGITPRNRDAAIDLMRSHFVDSPWASGWVLPTPKAADFDEKNQLKTELDFSYLDKWIAMWPDARRYFIFYNAQTADSFADAKMGTPEFNAKIASWLKAVVAHLETLGVKPSQLVLCPIDEAYTDAKDLHLLHWGRALKAAVPEVLLFSDPIWRDPKQSKYPETFTLPDILSPHPGWSPEFYQDIARRHNTELWLYNIEGMGKLGDPQLVYRQMAWHVYEFGGMGEGFWSFGDINSAPTSWQEYSAVKRTLSPVFLDEDTVYSSLHWEAMREGVEDFEELSMLADAIKTTRDANLKQQAQQVLDAAVQTVTKNNAGNEKNEWSHGNDPRVTDEHLKKVRAMLEKLSSQK